MQKYQNNITSRTGDAVSDLHVTVSLSGGGLATIYADNAGTPKDNPITTDANGYFEFYVADGRYNITVNGGGYNDVLIADALLISAALDGLTATTGAISATTGRVVNSIAALRTLSKLVYATAEVTGNAALGDGVSRSYYYDAADTTSTDNGGTVIVAADGGRWKFLTNARQSGQFFTEYGASVAKFGDRLFVGGAADHAGDNETVQDDWLTIYQIAKGRTNGFIQTAQVAMLNSTNINNQNAQNSLVLGAETKNLYDGYNAAALIGIAVANRTTGIGHCYAGYFEAYREVGVTGGAYGVEVDVMNYAAAATTDPYQQATGQTIGIQVAAGGEYPTTGQFEISAAINIRKNVGADFKRGIVFGSNSLTGADGTTGTAEAIVMGNGHKLAWYSGAGVATSSIYCVGTTALDAIEQRFVNSAINFRNVANSKPVFQISAASGGAGVNYLSAQGAIAAGAPVLAALGDDTNIDLKLMPKNTGVVSFGTYTAGAVAQAGYITVKDSGGTTRRLLVG
jgi:hypothetical protein